MNPDRYYRCHGLPRRHLGGQMEKGQLLHRRPRWGLDNTFHSTLVDKYKSKCIYIYSCTVNNDKSALTLLLDVPALPPLVPLSFIYL